MWTEITRPKYEREGQRYASDLTDAEQTRSFLHRQVRRGTVRLLRSRLAGPVHSGPTRDVRSKDILGSCRMSEYEQALVSFW
jgi:hypothetical protein